MEKETTKLVRETILEDGTAMSIFTDTATEYSKTGTVYIVVKDPYHFPTNIALPNTLETALELLHISTILLKTNSATKTENKQ